MRKKWLLGALVGVTALAVAAVALASPQHTQTIDIDLTKSQTAKSVGINSTLIADDPGAQPPGNIPASTNVVITLPPGTKANTKAGPQCNLSTTDVTNNKCPKNTVVGTGSALANVVLGPQGPVIPNVNASVTAYNRAGALAMRVVSQATSVLPSVTIPIIGKLSKKGVLTVPVPVLHPAGPTSKVILTQFRLNIKAKSKTVGKGKKKKKINLLTSPAKCAGTWTTSADFTYDDGTSKQDITSTQPCKRPAKRR